MIATLAMIACFAVSAACMVALLFQAVARNVTVSRHLRDAFAAAVRGKSPPRAPWPPPKPDYERTAELERELGMDLPDLSEPGDLTDASTPPEDGAV